MIPQERRNFIRDNGLVWELFRNVTRVSLILVGRVGDGAEKKKRSAEVWMPILSSSGDEARRARLGATRQLR